MLTLQLILTCSNPVADFFTTLRSSSVNGVVVVDSLTEYDPVDCDNESSSSCDSNDVITK